MRTRLEVNLTYRCSTVCKFCNRLVGKVSIPDSDITLEQLDQMIDALKADNVTMRYMKVLGGEPLVHYDFLGAMRVLKRAIDEGITKKIVIVTNCLHELPDLPEEYYEYWKSPIKEKNHIPMMVSPADAGVEHLMRDTCITKKRCGFSFDAWGFTFCPLSGVLGRVLRKNTYADKLSESHLDKDICRHCPFSLSVGQKRKLTKRVKNKDLNYPTETYRDGLKQHQEDPIEFEKFGVEKVHA